MTKTLAQRLLIKPGASLWTDADGTLALLGPLPEGVERAGSLTTCDVGVVSVTSRDAAEALVAGDAAALHAPRVLWLLYPKGGRADVNRDSLWRLMAAAGVRPVTQVSVDDTWSALRFRPLTETERAAAARDAGDRV